MVPSHVPDRLDDPVGPGDWIAYGVGRGYISIALILEIRRGPDGVDYDHVTKICTPVETFKLVVKSPDNIKPSILEASRRHFVKIPARPAGTEINPRHI